MVGQPADGVTSLTVDACVWVAAFDRADRCHADAAAFLGEVARRGVRVHAPRMLLVEVRCAVARRAGDATAGARAEAALRTAPFLQLDPLDDRLLETAGQAGADRRLRSGDALYVASAIMNQAPLVSYDRELVERAGAIRPDRVFADGRGSV